MAVFDSTEKMYDVLGSLFRVLMADPVVSQKYREANIIIRFSIFDPEGYIWLTNEDVICGPADLKPTVEMTLSGDTCHNFWLQKVSMPVALAKGQIKAKGPMPKILQLLPLLKPAYQNYPRIAREYGLSVE